jgi:hypothetical protein
MKGSSVELIQTAISFFIIAGVVLFGIIFVASNYVETRIRDISTADQLNAVDITHILGSCLADRYDIDSTYLDTLTGKPIEEFCSLGRQGVAAKVYNSVSKKTWYFGEYDEKGSPSHSIYVTITTDGKVDPGRLHVQL